MDVYKSHLVHCPLRIPLQFYLLFLLFSCPDNFRLRPESVGTVLLFTLLVPVTRFADHAAAAINNAVLDVGPSSESKPKVAHIDWSLENTPCEFNNFHKFEYYQNWFDRKFYRSNKLIWSKE